MPLVCFTVTSHHFLVPSQQAALSVMKFNAYTMTTTLPVLLSYRRDVLDTLELEVPDTWDQMLNVRVGMCMGARLVLTLMGPDPDGTLRKSPLRAYPG